MNIQMLKPNLKMARRRSFGVYKQVSLVLSPKAFSPFKRQIHKLIKHTQTICRQIADNCLSVLDHFVGLVLKRLTWV